MTLLTVSTTSSIGCWSYQRAETDPAAPPGHGNEEDAVGSATWKWLG